MSFSADVKRELCRQTISNKCCALAEAYGILLYCNTFDFREIRIITESVALKSRLPVLFRKAFRIEFDSIPLEEEGKGTFLIRDEEKLRRIFEAFGYERSSAVALHVNFGILEEEHCRISFFRGAFLAGGSVTDPEKNYHLELATPHFNVSKETTALMHESNILPKAVSRAGNYVLYFKQSEQIEDFLTSVGAPIAAMEVMNTKLEKNLRGSINRRVNCDAANLDKVVAAAQEQIEAIHALCERGGLDDLPDKLKEAARLRLENPELTLSQLAELCDPVVTKSTFNHRLRKVCELGRKKEEELQVT
jgi:DNA-binding protein WhiA